MSDPVSIHCLWSMPINPCRLAFSVDSPLHERNPITRGGLPPALQNGFAILYGATFKDILPKVNTAKRVH